MPGVAGIGGLAVIDCESSASTDRLARDGMETSDGIERRRLERGGRCGRIVERGLERDVAAIVGVVTVEMEDVDEIDDDGLLRLGRVLVRGVSGDGVILALVGVLVLEVRSLVFVVEFAFVVELVVDGVLLANARAFLLLRRVCVLCALRVVLAERSEVADVVLTSRAMVMIEMCDGRQQRSASLVEI